MTVCILTCYSGGIVTLLDVTEIEWLFAIPYIDLATAQLLNRSGDRMPVGARISTPVQSGPEAHPTSCTMGNGSFPGQDAAGA